MCVNNMAEPSCAGTRHLFPVTVYLDEQTNVILAQASKLSGVSKSQWVRELILRHVGDAWLMESRAWAGAFPDFPMRQLDTD